jgi:hypothetical protein
MWPGYTSSSRYSDSLLASRFWVQTQVVVNTFYVLHTSPDGSWGPPSPLYNRYQFSDRKVALATPPPPSSSEVSGREKLYLYSHLCLLGM